jgi:hypothetical protein
MSAARCKLQNVPSLTDAQLSFTAYVQEHKRAALARARQGAAYAFGPEQRTRLRLGRLRPVVLALDLGLAQFDKTGRQSLLAGAVEINEGQFPALARLLAQAVLALGLRAPRAFVSPTVEVRQSNAYGTADEAILVLPAAFIDHMSSEELQCTLASDLGRIHNAHPPLLTAWWVLQTDAPAALRWMATPALLLLASWARGADITADRAGLLVSRNLVAMATALAKRLGAGRQLLADIHPEHALQNLDSDKPDPQLGLELEDWNQWRMRVKAMRLFEQTAFYKAAAGSSTGVTGMSLAQCNDEIAKLLGAS